MIAEIPTRMTEACRIVFVFSSSFKVTFSDRVVVVTVHCLQIVDIL